MPGGTAWGFASHPDAEAWSGTFATREEAIAAGRETYGEERFAIRSGTMLVASEHLPLRWLFDETLERTEESAYEACGIEDDDIFDAKLGAEEALKLVMQRWADEYLSTDKWVADGKVEMIGTEDE